MRLLAECFEDARRRARGRAGRSDGLPQGRGVANVVVPTADYVRFATHFGFRPDFCEAADPESKGVVEALVRYAQADLIVPAEAWSSEHGRSERRRAAAWCAEVNGRRTLEIAAVPDERLVERAASCCGRCRRCGRRCVAASAARSTSCRRCGSARPATRCPRELVGSDVEVIAADGEVVHRATATRRRPPPRWSRPGEVSHRRRALRRPTTRRRPGRSGPAAGAERAFLALGPVAEAFLRAAAAAGTTKLGTELAAIVALEAGLGPRRAASPRSSGRIAFRRFTRRRRALDPRSRRRRPDRPRRRRSRSRSTCPTVADPSAWPPIALEALAMTAARRPPLAADLVAGLQAAQAGHGARHRPRGAADRQDPALGARGGAPHPRRGRDRRPRRVQRPRPAARRRVPGRQDPRRVQGRRCPRSPRPPSTTSPSLEWIARGREPVPRRPRRHRQEPPAPRPRPRRRRRRPAGPLLRRRRPRRDPLPRPGRQPRRPRSSTACCAPTSSSSTSSASRPSTLAGTQLLFRFVAAAYERRSLGIASHWPFDAWGRFLPEHTTAASLLDRLLHHAVVVVTEGESYRMREARDARRWAPSEAA